MSPIRLLPIVALATIFLAGCGGGSDTSTSASTLAATTPAAADMTTGATTTPTTASGEPTVVLSAPAVRNDGKVSKADVVLISTAVNRITAECVRRRNTSGTVGAPTAGFEDAVDVLVAEYADTPNRKFKRTGQSARTNMHATLQRIGTSLATPAPKGCGSTEKGGTDAVSKKIRAALIAKRTAKSSSNSSSEG